MGRFLRVASGIMSLSGMMGDPLKLSLRFDVDGQIGWQLVIGLKKSWNCRDNNSVADCWLQVSHEDI